MPRSDRQRFWDLLCAFSNAVYSLFVAGIVLLTLTLLSIVSFDQLSPAARVLVQVNAVLVTIILFASGYVLYRCRD